MVYSDLSHLFLSDEYRLPYLEADDTKSFLHLFSERMKRFVNDLNDLDDLAFKTIEKEIVIHDVSALIKSLEGILKKYLDGYPAEAYTAFRKTAEADPFFQDLNYLRIFQVSRNTPFFRSKKAYDKTFSPTGTGNGFSTAINSREMFHVAFEKRRAIGTNRYSIPGFPCIYLSDHLQTSWSECMNDDTEPFYAICFRNHRPLYFVDLVPLNVIIEKNGGTVPDTLYGRLMTTDEALSNYALVYPLICACHSKISYIEAYTGEVKFKSEYIIPQLLMQWYREQNLLIDGIRYLSCTAESKFPGSTMDKHNFVVPVDECLETGYCPTLLLNFSGTAVYGYNSPAGKPHNEMLNEIQEILAKEAAKPM